MNLQELKSRVNILDVAKELGLQLDKNNKCLCPFHNDKNPSLQFSEKKQIATCFSGNCSAGTMDVIELVKKFYSWELPQAKDWLLSFIGNYELGITNETKTSPSSIIDYHKIFKELELKFTRSNKAKDYLQSRHLTAENIEVGYNPGKEYKHLKYCLVFPLKNKDGEVVSLYGRSILANAKGKHYYITNRKGLYPCYPSKETKTLILTESIIDGITLNQYLLSSLENTSVLALYGTNGLTSEHIEAIKNLELLEEIVLWLDGDKAGKQATTKYKKELQTLFPKVNISHVDMLENEDVNSLLETHEPSIYQHLYGNRIPLAPEGGTSKEGIPPSGVRGIKIESNYAVYEDLHVKVELMGKIDMKDLSKLKVTTIIYSAERPNSTPSRNSVDLYNDDAVEKLVRRVAGKIEVGTSVLLGALDTITRELEHYRLNQQSKIPEVKKERYELRILSQQEEREALATLQNPNLKNILLEKLKNIGVIGEELNALFLLIILISRKTNHPLNAMVQGTSGSGKSHLIKKVADCMHNQNKVKRFTRVTDKSFYNYGEYDLSHCVIILEDYDGLTEEAELAWRELQSNHQLTSSVSVKNEQTGEISTGEKFVYGPIASLVATTNFRVYEDNESRVFIIAIDESQSQTDLILEYMSKKASKEITSEQEQKELEQLQNMIHLLKPYTVKNPYRLELPKTTHHRRRLTQMLHDYIEQVTILYQYMRNKENDILITELEDIELAIELMFNSIVLKTDELDGILRQFYEDLKDYIKTKPKEYEFTQREIRQHFRISKTQMFRYIKELEELEYISRSSIGARNIYKYKIAYWDNIDKLRGELKAHLQSQIDAYKMGKTGT